PYEAGRFVDASRGLCARRIGGWSPKDLNDNRDLELRREQREGERVAYVAATRARDLLVVPAVGDGPYADGWVAPLNAAIYPPDNARRTPARAAGCPAFTSKDSVLERPEGDPATSRTVCPGEHRIGSGADTCAVVWWSPEPAVLNLDAEAPLGLRRDDLIVKDVSPDVRARYLREYMAWRDGRQQAVSRAQAPSIDVITATEAALRGDGFPIDVAVTDVAPDVVRRVVGHPLFADAARAAQAGLCYRETPVTLRLESGALVEGIVDLAYQAEGEVVVVDFKTDRELEGAMETYRRQVQIYAHAIALATGRPTRGVLMKI